MQELQSKVRLEPEERNKKEGTLGSWTVLASFSWVGGWVGRPTSCVCVWYDYIISDVRGVVPRGNEMKGYAILSFL
jgi:hypothetical protein